MTVRSKATPHELLADVPSFELIAASLSLVADTMRREGVNPDRLGDQRQLLYAAISWVFGEITRKQFAEYCRSHSAKASLRGAEPLSPPGENELIR